MEGSVRMEDVQIQSDREMAHKMQDAKIRQAHTEGETQMLRQRRTGVTPVEERGPDERVEAPPMAGVTSQQFMEMMGTMMDLLRSMQNQTQGVQQPGPSVPSPSVLPVVAPGLSALEAEARERERRQEARADMRAFQGLNPPSFSGDGDYTVVDGWVAQMEKLFDFHQCDDRVKVRYATFMFRGQAEEWWRSVRDGLPGGGNNMSWPDFLRVFYGQFFPSSEQERRAEEFAQLVQGKLTVAEYEAKFRSLCKFASWVTLDPQEKGKKFQRGLKPSIRRLVALCKLDEYADIVDRARLVEHEEEERNKALESKKRPQRGGAMSISGGDGRSKRPRFQQFKRGGVVVSGAKGGGPDLICYLCG